MLRSRKRFAEAAETYTKAVDQIGTPDREPLDAVLLSRHRPTSAPSSGPKAEADLKKALELVPDGQPTGKAQVLNYLAYSWVDMGLNIDEAFKMLQRAVELVAPRRHDHRFARLGLLPPRPL